MRQRLRRRSASCSPGHQLLLPFNERELQAAGLVNLPDGLCQRAHLPLLRPGHVIVHFRSKQVLDDPKIQGLEKLVGLFFTPSSASQAAGQAFVARLAERKQDREPISGPKVAQAQIAAFRAWEQVDGERFQTLRRITQPTLIVNGIFDNMIPVRNSYYLAEHLPNGTLLVYPDAGHGSLFQYHDSFVRQASVFLDHLTRSVVPTMVPERVSVSRRPSAR